jgi:hypothetical protein
MKKFHLLIATLFLFLMSSCSYSITYFGDKYSATSSIDIYYSVHDVKKDYKVIGHLTCPYAGQTIVKKQLSSYAKKIGADAIIITGTESSDDHQASTVKADALRYTN